MTTGSSAHPGRGRPSPWTGARPRQGLHPDSCTREQLADLLRHAARLARDEQNLTARTALHAAAAAHPDPSGAIEQALRTTALRCFGISARTAQGPAAMLTAWQGANRARPAALAA